MINLAALDAPESAPASTGAALSWLTVDADGHAYDADGLIVPPMWQAPGWLKLTPQMRIDRSNAYRVQLATPPPTRVRRPYAKRFTTDYAVRYGGRQGWRLLQRETYDARLKRHHDLLLGVDALFDSPDGLVGIQGAGRHERASHYAKFVLQGGPEGAARLSVRVLYLEFVRESHDPVVMEWWA